MNWPARQLGHKNSHMQPPQIPATISVVIPAYNAALYIDACLDSVNAQMGDFCLEVIVVDDGSTDDTVKCLQRHPEVRLYKQVQRGPSAARNAGIEMASGEWLAFLDADDLWPPGSLQSRLLLMTRYPDAGLAFGDCRQFTEEGPYLKTVFEDSGYGPARFGHPERVPRAYALLLENNFITTGSVLVKTALLREIGSFDESLRLVEDMDIWLRIAASQPIVYSSEVCLLRRRHGNNTSGDAEAMSNAYLAVLARQARINGKALRHSGVSLNRCYALEYAERSTRALAAGRRGRALVAALHSLRWAVTRPGLTTLLGCLLPVSAGRRHP